jgi:hypothetical protein
MPIIGILASAITGNLGLSVDYLVVAGGGGGGSVFGSSIAAGGGGAGGMRYRYLTGGGGSLESFNFIIKYSYTQLQSVQVAAGAGQDTRGTTRLAVILYFLQLLHQVVELVQVVMLSSTDGW